MSTVNKLAGFKTRFLAFCIDIVLLVPVTLLGDWARSWSVSLGILLHAVTGLACVGYFVVGHKSWGVTVGKRLLGLRVLSVDGSPVDCWQSIRRSSIHLLYVLVTSFGFASLALSLPEDVYNEISLWSHHRVFLAKSPELQIVFNLYGVFSIVDGLFVIWSKSKRSLRDRLAGTIVIHTK